MKFLRLYLLCNVYDFGIAEHGNLSLIDRIGLANYCMKNRDYNKSHKVEVKVVRCPYVIVSW